jgi:hypothetical protein
VAPVQEIVDRIVAEAEAAIGRSAAWIAGSGSS